MNKLLKHIKNLDWVIIICTTLLFSMGSVIIFASLKNDLVIFYRQLIFFILSIGIMIFFSFFDWRSLKESHIILTLYLAGITLLAGLFVFAPQLRNVRRWYVIGPVSFDPVEFVKIVLIILLAKYFSGRHAEMYKVSHIILSGIYVFIPSAITLFQPDLGSSIILLSLWVGILLISGIKTKHFIILCFIGLLALILSWSFLLKDYQKARITAFVAPRVDPQGINWNPEQARIAIGSGGIFGQGIGKGGQTQHGFLPEARTDFIFSSIAEEMGLLGVSVLLFLFGILFWRIINIAIKAPDNFSKLFCSGFAILLITQIFVNIGMNQGILPIVGIPLPFVSYGGSNLLFTFLILGIIQSIKLSSEI